MERADEVIKDKKLGVCFEASRDLKKYVFGDTIDELIDGLELLNDGIFVNEFVWKFPDLTEKQLERLDTLMAKTTNAEEIVKYAIRRGKKLSNREKIEKRLVELQGVYEICEYAEKCQVNDIEVFVDFICDEKASPYEICRIAKINGADLLKLKKAMFEIKDTNRYLYQLICFCSYCQKQRPDIITSDDVKMLEKLAIDYNDASDARACAEYVKGVNIEKLQKVVEESKEAAEILNFAQEVKGADIDSLRKAMRKTKYAYYIEIFEREFGGISTIDKIKSFFK